MGSPTVPATVRLALEDARRCGIDFDSAWTSATSNLPKGNANDSWTRALLSTRRAREDAYLNRPARVEGARAVDTLHELWFAA
jgi:hypothetical protein